MSEQQQTGRIVGELRRGVLSATMWANETRNGEMLSVTLRRGFERKPGEWGETKMTIPVDRLLTAAEMLREMHAHAWEHRAAQNAEEKEVRHE